MSSVNQTKSTHPPKFIEEFLHWRLPKELKEPVLGDLAEEYAQLFTSQPFRANYWYSRQALSTGLQFLTKTKRGLIMFLFGILVFVGMVILAMVMGGDFYVFINVPSLLIILPPSLLFTLGCTSKQSRSNAFSLLLSDDMVLDKAELNAAKHVFSIFGNMNMLMGVIGVIIGAILISSSIESESFGSHFGPALAVCLLTLFYSSLIKALCYAAESKIQFQIISQG
jgi:chemotaxis protein MotA